jgi:hypothetical protein
MGDVRGKNDDFPSHIGEDRKSIIWYVKWTIILERSRFACFEFCSLQSLVQVWNKDTIDVLKRKLAFDVGCRSLLQIKINTRTNAAADQHPPNGPRVLRYHSTRGQRLSTSGDARNYPYLSHISWHAMIYHLTLDCLWDEDFHVLPVFLFRHIDFVEVKDQLCFHPLDIISQAAYCCVQENTWNFRSLFFLWCTFYFRGFVSMTYRMPIINSESRDGEKYDPKQ